MNEVQIFQNEEFGRIRAFGKNGEPWFVGKDVAKILGYKNTNAAIIQHVDEEDRVVEPVLTPPSQNTREYKTPTTVINESGLYSLILSSKLPTAKKFKRWVTSEVLPAIRKNGKYELISAEIVEDMPKEESYLDLNQLELDQRIKIATIIASCRRERLALVAKVLSLDVEELKPVTPRKNEEDTETGVCQFIDSEWERIEEKIPVALLYGRYQNWCRLRNIRPVSKQIFGSIILRTYPVESLTMRYKMSDGSVKSCKGYRKIEVSKGGAAK